MNESVNYETVDRTAPATPGLLKTKVMLELWLVPCQDLSREKSVKYVILSARLKLNIKTM